MNKDAALLFAKKAQEIATLCNESSVKKLLVFGSALKPSWNSKSDVDCAVVYKEDKKQNHLKLHAGLCCLFGRDVHLIDVESVRNPYFKQVVLTEGRRIF